MYTLDKRSSSISLRASSISSLLNRLRGPPKIGGYGNHTRERRYSGWNKHQGSWSSAEYRRSRVRLPYPPIFGGPRNRFKSEEIELALKDIEELLLSSVYMGTYIISWWDDYLETRRACRLLGAYLERNVCSERSALPRWEHKSITHSLSSPDLLSRLGHLPNHRSEYKLYS